LRNGVLIGVGGVFGNVVRMQPPLVISRQQLDRALDVVEQAFAEVSGKKVRAAS
jgi:4-aminobutyrate aminotransferase-like enzyme